MKGLDDHLQCKTLGDSFDFFFKQAGPVWYLGKL